MAGSSEFEPSILARLRGAAPRKPPHLRRISEEDVATGARKAQTLDIQLLSRNPSFPASVSTIQRAPSSCFRPCHW